MGRNVTLGSGKAVHYSSAPEGYVAPDCGGNRGSARYTVTTREVTCKNCIKIMAAESEQASASATNIEGETMAEKTETDHAATVDQIVANSERAVSLAEAENVDGLEELGKDTEALISSLPSRGRYEPEGGNARSWAQVKKDLRTQWREAAQAKPKPEPAKAVAKHEPAPPAKYTDFEGVEELVTLGAEKLAEGVRLHLRTSDVAKEIAAVGMDIIRRIPNKNGNPDIMLTAQQSRDAMSALYRKAGEGFERNRANEKALKSLQRSVQYYRGDVRAQLLRGLDGDDAEAEDERKPFAAILANKPEDVAPSVWVAKHYDTALKGQDELEEEEWQQQRAIESGDASTEPEAPVDPNEKVKTAVSSFLRDISKAVPDDFEASSEETKAAVREDLLKIADAVKAMIAATI